METLSQRFILFPLILLSFVAQKSEGFNKLKTYEPRTFEINAGASYFETTSNFNSVGTKLNLLGTNKFSLLDSFLESRYVMPGYWSVRGQAFISNSESRNTDFNRANSTLNALAASVDWMVYRGFMDLIPELSVRYSLDEVSLNQDSVMNNEGVMEVAALLKAQNNYGAFSYYLGGGYLFRSERSGVLPWYLGGGLSWGHSFIGLEVNGFQTITQDGDTGAGESARYSLIQRVNGGSYRFYSVNPSHIQAALNIDIGFSSAMVLRTFIANSVSGQNYSNGMTAGIQLSLLFDAISNSNSEPRETYEAPVIKKSGAESYQIQTTDGVDQNLFEKEPEVQAVPVKKKRTEPTDEEIQDQLDQAEMSIKLKSKKKSKKKKKN